MERLKLNNYSCYTELVLKQLQNYWFDIDVKIIEDTVPLACQRIMECYCNNPDTRYYKDGQVVFSPRITVHWMQFLYRLSHEIFKKWGRIKEADYCYYLNKIMHSNDWFYEIDLPVHFLFEHPIGSVLGRASYGDYLVVYQGTTIGGNRKDGLLTYPKIGNNVILFAGSSILGKTQIGDNVVVAADTFMIDEIIPDNCIVFGKTPNLIIKEKSENEIKSYTKHIWGWEL